MRMDPYWVHHLQSGSMHTHFNKMIAGALASWASGVQQCCICKGHADRPPVQGTIRVRRQGNEDHPTNGNSIKGSHGNIHAAVVLCIHGGLISSCLPAESLMVGVLCCVACPTALCFCHPLPQPASPIQWQCQAMVAETG